MLLFHLKVEFELLVVSVKYIGTSSSHAKIILFLENYISHIMESVIITSSKFIHMIPSLTKSIYIG